MDDQAFYSVPFEDHPIRITDLPEGWGQHYSHVYYRESSGKLLRLDKEPGRITDSTQLRYLITLSECFDEPVPVPRGHPWSSHTGHFLDDTFQPYHWFLRIHQWVMSRAEGHAFYVKGAQDMETFLRQIVVDVL